jgi:hypothetical protein
MVLKRRARRDSCRIRWLGFLFIRRRQRRENRREKLLLAPVERLHAACDTQLQEAHGRAPKPHHSFSGTERSSNRGNLWPSRPGKDRRTCDDRGRQSASRRGIICRLSAGNRDLKTLVLTKEIEVEACWRRTEG